MSGENSRIFVPMQWRRLWTRIAVACLLVLIEGMALIATAQVDNFAIPKFKRRQAGEYDTLGQEKSTQLANESVGLLEREIDPTLYLLGPGDILSISIPSSDPLLLKVPVSPEGSVSIPRVGVISLKGLTLAAARTTLQESISRTYRTTPAQIELMKIRQFKVYVLGAVRVPSVVAATPADRVFDVIRMAGGVLDTAAVRGITLRREGVDTPIIVDLRRYLTYGDKTHNPTVQGGDRIIVPLRTAKNTISIYGEVYNEGSFDFLQGDSLSTLVRFAGGFLPSALLDSVKLVRLTERGGGELEEFTVNLHGWQEALQQRQPLPKDIELRSGDRLYVRAIPKFNERHEVILAGEVVFPGRYAIEPNVTRLTDVIAQAGGFTEKASIGDAVIIRQSEMELKDAEYERLSKLPPSEMSTRELQYYRTKSREVKGVISVNFEDLFVKKNLQNNPLLRDRDSIVVPLRNYYVNVTGSVRNPGRIVYQPQLKYMDYIELAGGFGFRADREATFVVKTKGDQFPADDENYTLEPGDNILVLDEPETRFIDVFTQVLTITAQIVTIVGVVLTITRLQ